MTWPVGSFGVSENTLIVADGLGVLAGGLAGRGQFCAGFNSGGVAGPAGALAVGEGLLQDGDRVGVLAGGP
jgi:hypothetical protein